MRLTATVRDPGNTAASVVMPDQVVAALAFPLDGPAA